MTVNKMHPFRLLFLVVAVLLAGVQAAAAASLDTAVARFTDTQDGRAAYVRAVETHFGAANDGGAGEARVLRLLAPLTEAAKMERPLVVVTARDDVNAYALPGMIVVHRGLLALVTDDGELSVLLAHELGHLAQGHPVRGIRRSMRAQYFARRAAKAKEPGDGANDFVQAALHADVGLHEERKATNGRQRSCRARASRPPSPSVSGITSPPPASPTNRARIHRMRNGSGYTGMHGRNKGTIRNNAIKNTAAVFPAAAAFFMFNFHPRAGRPIRTCGSTGTSRGDRRARGAAGGCLRRSAS